MSGKGLRLLLPCSPFNNLPYLPRGVSYLRGNERMQNRTPPSPQVSNGLQTRRKLCYATRVCLAVAVIAKAGGTRLLTCLLACWNCGTCIALGRQTGGWRVRHVNLPSLYDTGISQVSTIGNACTVMENVQNRTIGTSDVGFS